MGKLCMALQKNSGTLHRLANTCTAGLPLSSQLSQSAAFSDIEKQGAGCQGSGAYGLGSGVLELWL